MKIIQAISVLFYFLIFGVNILSYFSAITKTSMVILFLVSLSSSVYLMKFNIVFLKISKSFITKRIDYLVFILLFFILLIQGFSYPPNTWDSMTYHMSRIVYWMQNHSIEYFVTNNSRQNILTPGAEIIILFPQLLLETDRFANFLQLFGWILVYLSNVSIAKILNPNISKNNLILVGILSLSIPMSLLQATSTQNDLICSGFLCLSIFNLIVVSRKPKFILGWFHLGVSVSLIYLIKPTGILFFLPFTIYFLIKDFSKLRTIRKAWINMLFSFFIVLLIVIPDMSRKFNETGTLNGDRYNISYTFSDSIQTRFLNSAMGLFYHFPYVEICNSEVYKTIADNTISAYPKQNPCLSAKTIHEDLIGNPVHILLLLFLPIIFLFSTNRFNVSHRLFITLPLFSWILFHFFIKDQPWISRLQLPLFSVLPLTLVYLRTIKLDKILVLLCMFSFVLSLLIINLSASRPFVRIFDLNFNRTNSYYTNLPKIKERDNRILIALEKNNCRKFGLLMSDDSWDYPLSWFLFKKGINVEHITSKDGFSGVCAVYDEKKDAVIYIDNHE